MCIFNDYHGNNFVASVHIETIILWKEYSQTLNIDYALSFQEALGCQDIW